MKYFISIAMVAFVLFGCNPSSTTEETAGSTEENAQQESARIVSLNGTLTEILFALNEGENIVGLDVTSTYPETEVANLPKVGHVRNVQAEGILSLNPTVIYALKDELNPQLISQLEPSGVEIRLFQLEHSPEGAYALIKAVGTDRNKEEEAEKLQKSISEKLANFSVKMENTPRALFIYARGAGTLMVAGENTQMDAMIRLAGGENAVSGFEDFQPLTPEALAAANPDVIVMFNGGAASLMQDGGVMAIPGIDQTTAGKNNHVVTMDGLKLSGFGPRLAEAVMELNHGFKNGKPSNE